MSWEALLLHATQPFVEFLQVRQKPHLGATVGFAHKIFERAALSHVPRDAAQDHEAPSVRHEFGYFWATHPKGKIRNPYFLYPPHCQLHILLFRVLPR